METTTATPSTVVDLMCQMNRLMGRHEYCPNPIPVDSFLMNIGKLMTKCHFAMNQDFLKCLGCITDGTLVCIRGVFGQCDPTTCPVCLNMKNHVAENVWTIWQQQHRPLINAPLMPTICTGRQSPSLEEAHGVCCSVPDRPFRRPVMPARPLNRIEPDDMLAVSSPFKRTPRPTDTEAAVGAAASNSRARRTYGDPSYDAPNICHYGNRCNNNTCDYLHPYQIECKYGDRCNRPDDCSYRHPDPGYPANFDGQNRIPLEQLRSNIQRHMPMQQQQRNMPMRQQMPMQQPDLEENSQPAYEEFDSGRDTASSWRDAPPQWQSNKRPEEQQRQPDEPQQKKFQQQAKGPKKNSEKGKKSKRSLKYDKVKARKNEQF